jgi:hypothetical protein
VAALAKVIGTLRAASPGDRKIGVVAESDMRCPINRIRGNRNCELTTC